MSANEKSRLALISVSGDPAAEIGQEEAGGQNVYVRQVGLALAQQGWIVDMFTRRISPAQAAIVQHTPKCRTIRLTAGPSKFINRDEVFGYLPEFVQQFQEFQKQEGFEYPLVHTNYWLSSWVGMELKKHQPLKQVHTYHSLGAVKYRAVSNLPVIASTRLAVEKACLETAERIVATSPQEEEHMRTLVSLKGFMEIIPCGTDIDRMGMIKRQDARQKLKIPPTAKVVLYVGRFDRRKGIETLVRAIAQSNWRSSPDLQLIIAGGFRPGESDGLECDRIKGIVKELGLDSITAFPGRLTDEELPSYYAAADVCVVPSHYEPFGLVAIEAMACRTPVVASQVGGLQFTVIPEITGLLVPPKDDLGFAQAIDRILSNPELAEQLGELGRQRVEIAMSWGSVAARLSNLYTKLLSQSAPVSPKTSSVAA
ncbi:MAG TPA: glycosyltransferase [Waterburya sp.]|jgi:glycosyltransferase involved in cell wall biosynthesis